MNWTEAIEMNFTDSQLELQAHLENKKTEVLAWIDEDPDNRWGGYPTTDVEHWAAMGITSVEQYERYNLEATVWDLYKEVHGMRPRHMNFAEMTNIQLEQLIERLQTEWN
jgi:hypothetical protein